MPQRFPSPQALVTSQQQVHLSCLPQAGPGGSQDASIKQHDSADGVQQQQPVVTTSTAVCLGDSSSDQSPPAALAATVDATVGDPLGVQGRASTAAAADAAGDATKDGCSAGSSAGKSLQPRASEGAASAADDSGPQAQWPKSCAAFVCGIQPDWHTPLSWLHVNMKAADGFLYVVVHTQDGYLV